MAAALAAAVTVTTITVVAAAVAEVGARVGLGMVIHYQPGRLRRNSDQPTAITNVLVATSGSSHRTGDIPLGIRALVEGVGRDVEIRGVLHAQA